jgi:hypothetical protein
MQTLPEPRIPQCPVLLGLCRHKHGADLDWTHSNGLFRRDSFIVNGGFETRGSQLLVGSFQVLRVVEYSDNDGFCIHL